MQDAEKVGKVTDLIVNKPRAAIGVMLFFAVLSLAGVVNFLFNRSDTREAKAKIEYEAKIDTLQTKLDRQIQGCIALERSFYTAQLAEKDKNNKQLQDLSNSWKEQKETLEKEVAKLSAEAVKNRNLSKQIK